MKRNLTCRVAITLVLLSTASLPRLASAAEPARDFLNELRAANLYDVAVEYLDKMKDSPLVSPEFKESLAYERGVTLVKGGYFIKDQTIREKQLDEAQTVLKDFITKQSKHPLVAAANNELGNLLVQRAGMRVEKAKKPAAASQKPALLKEARGMYDEALKLFAAIEAGLKADLERFPKVLDPKKDAKQIEARDQMRADYLQTQLLTAAVREEMADTEPKASKAANDLLLAAAKDYNEVYEKYRTRLAGLYARLYQGRCYVKMNNHKEALSYFSDLLDQPDQPEEFRTLKVKTLLMAVECWFGASPKKYDEAIKRLGPFLDTARPDEKKEEEFLALQLWLGKAYKALADDLTAREPAKKVEINKAVSEAKKLVTFVSKQQSEVQEEAKQLLLKLRGVDDVAAEEKPEPKTFADAKTAGKDALEAMQTAQFNVAELPKQIAAEKDAKLKAELEKQLAQAKQDVDTNRADAMKYYQLSLRLVDKDTTEDDLDVINYFLCFLNYNLGNLHESALLGEFIARQRSNSSGARQSAKIAMASYLKLYKEVQGEDKSFETAHIIGISQYILAKWPDQPEATEALNTLIPFMIKEGKLNEAEAYLANIPADAAPRGEAELKIGQSLWSTYLRGMQDVRKREQDGLATADELKVERTRLDDVKKRAEKTLTDGVTRMQKTGDVSPTVATAVLSLSQLYVDTNQAEKAVALLEDPKIGALTLLQKKDAAMSREGLVEETLKTALRAYISSLATIKAADSDAAVKKAESMMDELKATAGSTPEGQKKLVSIYVSLAKDLQSQMEIATPEVKKSLSKGFETFLKRVGSGATEMNILNWVAETFYGIATSFTGEKGGLAPEAKQYFTEADVTFTKMLEKGKTDKEFLTPQMTTQIRHRLAMTKRALGKFEAAVDEFESILKEHNTMLNVQIEAARTYQEWGAKGKDAKTRAEHYYQAMVGAKPDDKKKGENVIWGWGMLAKRTATLPQFSDTFFESRYQLAVSRYRQAEQFKAADKEKYQKTMQLAKQDIRLTRSLFPDLGGKEHAPQYNDLLKKIQTALGEKSIGLAELQTSDPISKTVAKIDIPKRDPVKEPADEATAKGAAKPKEPDKPAEPAGLPIALIVICAVGFVAGLGVVGFLLLRKKPRAAALHKDPGPDAFRDFAGVETVEQTK